jgi:hypothetical protein
LATLIIAVLFVLVTTPVYSGSVIAKLHIQARVLPSLEYRVLHEPPVFKITPADIKKGYKDVIDGTVLSVTTNNTNGYMLSVCRQESDVIDSITVNVGGVSHPLHSGGCVDLHIPFHSFTPNIMKMHYNIQLLPDTEADFYHWPIAVIVYSL